MVRKTLQSCCAIAVIVSLASEAGAQSPQSSRPQAGAARIITNDAVTIGRTQPAEPPTADAAPDRSTTGTPADARESTPIGSPGESGSALGLPLSGEETGATETAFPSASIGEFIRVGAALAIVIGLIFIMRFVMRKTTGGALAGGGRPSGVLEVLARYPVARGQSLVLLKLGRRLVLAHQTSTGMTTLTEVTEQNEVAALLTRLEAGSAKPATGGGWSRLFQRQHTGGPDDATFDAMLGRFEGDYESTGTARGDAASERPSPRGEVIDLTRRRGSSGGSVMPTRRLAR